MTAPVEILLATGNPDKAAEMARLLGNLPLVLRTRADFPVHTKLPAFGVVPVEQLIGARVARNLAPPPPSSHLSLVATVVLLT